MVLQQEDLKRVDDFNYFNEDSPCHIYLICRRPRILIDASKFVANEKKLVFGFKVQRQDKFEEFEIEIPNDADTQDFELISNYPYNMFQLKQEGKTILEGKSALLLQQFGYERAHYFDLEVLYIGQSYGVKGARTAPQRLQSHSTLQGIYSQAILKNPDSEIWLVLTSFEQILLTLMDGRIKVTEEEKVKDTEHLKKVTNTVLVDGLNEQQVINFTEASLIRHFQPPYNIEYKNTFPNPAHKTYSQCYDLDINTVCLEVNTENINCRLFSEKVEAHWWHMPKFFLHSREERIDMFDYDVVLGNKNEEK
jgi:hypothetical protein